MFARRTSILTVLVIMLMSTTTVSAFGAVTRYEESSGSIAYIGSWQQAYETPPSSGWRVLYSATAGNSATLTFTGTGVDWFAAKSTSQNVGEVFLDGVSQGTYSLQSATRTGNNLVWGIRGLSNTTHTVRIANVTPYVNIDAFDVYTPETITASTGSNGSITPSGSVSVDHGANQSFTISADAGYEVEDVLVDGVSVGAVSAYTFTNVTGPHTIAASFSPVAVVSTPASSWWSIAVMALVALGGMGLSRRRASA